MKVLNFSDLHRKNKKSYDARQQVKWIHNVMEETNPDIVVLSGDIVESFYHCNPYKHIYDIFENEVPVICVLGNHEFFNRTVQETLDSYRENYSPEKYDVHYLDIIGHYDFEKDGLTVRFVGNVLWYDGSMSTMIGQDLNTFADGNWADKYIKDFDYLKENKVCVEQIKANVSDDVDYQVLVTHCVPHKNINWHMFKIGNQFNAFSGMANLLEQMKFDYSISGHTHARVVGKEINGCRCINCGNDYVSLGVQEYFLLEI